MRSKCSSIKAGQSIDYKCLKEIETFIPVITDFHGCFFGGGGTEIYQS